ncbi:hypothetical protein GM658_11570 [Pseudoduganella eburnea]|uniref:Uncharacterized protein n=1 Tax=Massilia eburnea TaxID=1776165 RepID=A0A6L6QGG9_9BURK|nr:hypothetical protein [Massilia eburnea]MTW11231.1 hypothetical protein [Massilia eburnea]
MMSFSVTMRGRRAAADLSETVERLAKLTGRSIAETERFLAMPAVAVKRGVDLRTANRYQAALEDCGVYATIERESIAETSLDGIPEGFRKLPEQLRQADREHRYTDRIHAVMVGLLADGVDGPGLRFAMEQNLKGMCGGQISIEGLLRYFSSDRLDTILRDAAYTIDVYRRGGYRHVVNYGYGGGNQISAADSIFFTLAARRYEALLAILHDHGLLSPEGRLPSSVVLRDGKGELLRSQGQRVQFCHLDSPYVQSGTIEGCHAIGVEVTRPLRNGLLCTAMIPYANLMMDGGAFRPLPQEATLECRTLNGYALPQVPELKLKGNLEVELDLQTPPASQEHQAFFAGFPARVRERSGGRIEAARLAPGLFLVGRNLEQAAQVVTQVLEPLRLRS